MKSLVRSWKACAISLVKLKECWANACSGVGTKVRRVRSFVPMHWSCYAIGFRRNIPYVIRTVPIDSQFTHVKPLTECSAAIGRTLIDEKSDNISSECCRRENLRLSADNELLEQRNVKGLWCAACLFGGWLAFAANLSAWETRPNLVVLLCDDLGYGDLGCYGHPVIKTPNIDTLARNGIRLSACYSAAPVCSPSRVGLLTGRNPNRAGVFDWIPPATNEKSDRRDRVHMRQNEVTIASLLQEVGYATAMVGKWHCNSKFNSTEQPQPGDFGFDDWTGTQNNAWPSHHAPANFVRNGVPIQKSGRYSCQIVVGEALEWLDLRENDSQPFFLYLPFHEPHEPVASPPDLVTRYLPFAQSENEACYFANVANVDRAVGALVRGLQKRGLLDDTLIVFTSDNGPETLNRYGGAKRSYGRPGPLRGMKLHTHEAGVRVPGIMHWPSRIQPGLVDQPVSSLDLLPTFCELAGRDVPSDRALDGMSIVPLIDGKQCVRTKPLSWCYFNALNQARMAMRKGPWKVLAQIEGGKFPRRSNLMHEERQELEALKLTDFEIYNVANDIGESDNRGDQPSHETLRNELQELFSELIADSHLW